MTRPRGLAPDNLSLAEKLIIVPWLNRQQTGVGESYRGQPDRYRSELQTVEEQGRLPGGTVIAVAADGQRPEVSNIEKDFTRLQAGARDGFNAVYTAFGLDAPPPMPELKLF